MLADWLNALVAQLLGGYIKRECLEKADYNFCESNNFAHCTFRPLTGNSNNSSASVCIGFRGSLRYIKGPRIEARGNCELCIVERAFCHLTRLPSPQALYDLQLPIRLIRGYIGQITIRLPGLLGRSPVEVSVEQVFLVVATDYRHDGLWQDSE